MTQVTEAVYSDGVLRPKGRLSLRDNERVRLIIQSLESPDADKRTQAIEALRAGIGQSKFRSDGPYPTRDELHERR